MPARPPRPAGPAPNDTALHEAALAYLARYAATEAGLARTHWGQAGLAWPRQVKVRRRGGGG